VGSLKVKPGGSKQRPQNVYVLGRWVSETDFKGEETTKEYLFVFDILDSILFDANDPNA
jgi:hypothetical protein